MTPDVLLPLLSVIASATTTIVAIAIGSRDRKRDRDHAAQLAKEAAERELRRSRLDYRLKVYDDALRRLLMLRRTDNAESTEVYSRVSLMASQPFRDMVTGWYGTLWGVDTELPDSDPRIATAQTFLDAAADVAQLEAMGDEETATIRASEVAARFNLPELAARLPGWAQRSYGQAERDRIIEGREER